MIFGVCFFIPLCVGHIVVAQNYLLNERTEGEIGESVNRDTLETEVGAIISACGPGGINKI